MVIFEKYEQILPDNGPKLTLYQQQVAQESWYPDVPTE